jgi:molybdopterin synthase sulfur carrier subunit
MAVTVKIPTPLRNLTGDLSEVTAASDSITALVEELEGVYPGMRERLLDERGELRRFVNLFVNGEDIRFREGLETPLGEGDEISIVPAVAGGSELPATVRLALASR